LGVKNSPAPSALGQFVVSHGGIIQNLTKATSVSGRTAADVDREEQIRLLAYELYEARGRGDGHDVEDWLEAEAEINGATERAAS
jgi:hypothetical protein